MFNFNLINERTARVAAKEERAQKALEAVYSSALLRGNKTLKQMRAKTRNGLSLEGWARDFEVQLDAVALQTADVQLDQKKVKQAYASCKAVADEAAVAATELDAAVEETEVIDHGKDVEIRSSRILPVGRMNKADFFERAAYIKETGERILSKGRAYYDSMLILRRIISRA